MITQMNRIQTYVTVANMVINHSKSPHWVSPTQHASTLDTLSKPQSINLTHQRKQAASIFTSIIGISALWSSQSIACTLA